MGHDSTKHGGWCKTNETMSLKWFYLMKTFQNIYVLHIAWNEFSIPLKTLSISCKIVWIKKNIWFLECIKVPKSSFRLISPEVGVSELKKIQNLQICMKLKMENKSIN